MAINTKASNWPVVTLPAILFKAVLLASVAVIVGLVLGRNAIFQVGYFSEMGDVIGAPLAIGFQLFQFLAISRFIPYWYAYPFAAWLVSHSVLERLGLKDSVLNQRVVTILVYIMAYFVIFCIVTCVRFFAHQERYTITAKAGILVLFIFAVGFMPSIAKAVEARAIKNRIISNMILYPQVAGISPYTTTESEQGRTWANICYPNFKDDRYSPICDGLFFINKSTEPCKEAIADNMDAIEKTLPYSNKTTPKGRHYGEATFNVSAYKTATTTTNYKIHMYCFNDNYHEYVISRYDNNDISQKAHEQFPIDTMLDNLVTVTQVTNKK